MKDLFELIRSLLGLAAIVFICIFSFKVMKNYFHAMDIARIEDCFLLHPTYTETQCRAYIREEDRKAPSPFTYCINCR